MPKIKQQEYYDADEEEGEEEEEEIADVDADELEQPVQKKPSRKIKVKPKPAEVKRRFGIIAPQPLRAVDVETEEVLAEADANDTKSLVLMSIQIGLDNKERLERIETKLGVLTS